jgi:hypothetical protein
VIIWWRSARSLDGRLFSIDHDDDAGEPVPVTRITLGAGLYGDALEAAECEVVFGGDELKLTDEPVGKPFTVIEREKPM